MTKEKTTAPSNITRKQLIELLNEDLAGEYDVVARGGRCRDGDAREAHDPVRRVRDGGAEYLTK